MGWLRARLGESNTALGALLLYQIVTVAAPQYKPVVDAVAAALGVGFVVTPKA